MDEFYVQCLLCGAMLEVTNGRWKRAEIAHFVRKHFLLLWVLPIRYFMRAVLKGL